MSLELFSDKGAIFYNVKINWLHGGEKHLPCLYAEVGR